MSDLFKAVAELSAGDEVRAEFQELEDPNWDDIFSFPEPTGNTYTRKGIVVADQHSLGTSLYLSSNDQCLRQASGTPGGWLVSVEILKKG